LTFEKLTQDEQFDTLCLEAQEAVKEINDRHGLHLKILCRKESGTIIWDFDIDDL
jgi:hypothetical protein